MAFWQRVPVHAPGVRDPVAGLGGGFGWLVDSAGVVSGSGIECMFGGMNGLVWDWALGDGYYLTVRACSSIGAPERTAAGVVSPGSLPSITLAGTGEKFLRLVSAA